MYQLVRNLKFKQWMFVEMPALGMSVATAEIFYKFHSFSLECAAFLVTWFVFSAVFSAVAECFRPLARST